MKILITGNMGYIGPAVVNRLRTSYPETILVGLDMGYFANCLTTLNTLPECLLDNQYFGDVRNFRPAIVSDIDAVVYLAAISNDPMGATFENITLNVNYHAAVQLAKTAKEAGAKSFVFASSCSVYGFAEGGARTEDDPINPLTAYAKSKVLAERGLAELADKAFTVTCLRFATACGMSDRLRLDLVLNDFVASAVATGRITILSDGTPWRPLIHIKDMARAIDWAVQRDADNGNQYLAVNVGCDKWNYQVKDLAEAVKSVIPSVEITINESAPPDKRSYRVNFDKFMRLAPNFLPEVDLLTAVRDLKDGLHVMKFEDPDFRNSRFIRLNMLKHLKHAGHLTEDLKWAQWSRKLVVS
jgi:nucleoside-diphosphate-sugar epimerase